MQIPILYIIKAVLLKDCKPAAAGSLVCIFASTSDKLLSADKCSCLGQDVVILVSRISDMKL